MTGSGGAISDGRKPGHVRCLLRAWKTRSGCASVIAAVNTDLTLENVTIWPAQIKKGEPFEVTVTVQQHGRGRRPLRGEPAYRGPGDRRRRLCERGRRELDGCRRSCRWARAARTPFTVGHHRRPGDGRFSHALYVLVDSGCEIESNNLPASTGFTRPGRRLQPGSRRDRPDRHPGHARGPDRPSPTRLRCRTRAMRSARPRSALYLGAAPTACPDTPRADRRHPQARSGRFRRPATLVETLGLGGGSYAAFARADDGCQITETNESNNTTP